MTVSVNGQQLLTYAFFALVTDGRFGLISTSGVSTFDSYSIKTTDPASASNIDPIGWGVSLVKRHNLFFPLSALLMLGGCYLVSIPYLYDPSQQVARMSGEDIAKGVTGSYIVICNDYEYEIIREKTGMDAAAMLEHAAAVVVTKGEKGAAITLRDRTIEVPAVPPSAVVDPTGVGDAFRGGFMKGMAAGADFETCGRLGSVAAAYALEHMGGSSHVYTRDEWAERSRHYWIASTGLGMSMGVTVFLGILVGIVIVAQTLYTSAVEHIKEFGTVKAIGGSNLDIYRILGEQALIAAVIGFALGAAFSYAARPLMAGIHLNVLLSPGFSAAVFVGTVLMCLGAALFSFRRVAGIDPALVFRT